MASLDWKTSPDKNVRLVGMIGSRFYFIIREKDEEGYLLQRVTVGLSTFNNRENVGRFKRIVDAQNKSTFLMRPTGKYKPLNISKPDKKLMETKKKMDDFLYKKEMEGIENEDLYPI